MIEYQQHDIISASFDEFVEFLFAHEIIPIPKESSEPSPWYWQVEVEYDPINIAQYYTQLFSKPEFLVSTYTKGQLEQGFWAIQSCNLGCGVLEIIWETEISFNIREECVRAMATLFEYLFTKEPLDTSVNMWWDSLTFDYCCNNRSRLNGAEDAAMQDVMFETLTKILSQSAVHCQEAALHGLGHLMHPDTTKIIDKYIAKNKLIDPSLRDYAKEAARFEIM